MKILLNRAVARERRKANEDGRSESPASMAIGGFALGKYGKT